MKTRILTVLAAAFLWLPAMAATIPIERDPATNIATADINFTGAVSINAVLVEGLKNNRIAVIPPTVNDDNTGGYAVGSQWQDVSANKAYALFDATTGAAVWVETTSSGGDALVANPLSQFASTSSAQLLGVLSDPTGSGLAVFGTSPNITTPTGIVKGDVGLGNVDNIADASQTALGTVVSGDIAAILPDIAITDLANGTAGDLWTWSGAGTPVVLGTGLNGQHLTSNGLGNALTWTTPATGVSSVSGGEGIDNSGTAADPVLDMDIASLAVQGTPAAGMFLALDNGGTTQRINWNQLPGVAGGEANTGSNQGADGIGVFDTKAGIDLQFRHVAPGSANITTTLNVKDIDIDLAAVLDFGAKTSLEIPNSATPTVDADGEIAVDTNGDATNITQGVITYYDGTQQLYAAAFDAYPTTDGHVLTYDSVTNKLRWEATAAAGGVVKSIDIPAGAWIPDDTDPPVVGSDTGWGNRTLDTWNFDDTNNEFIHFSFTWPEDYDDTVACTVTVYFISNDNNASTEWQISEKSFVTPSNLSDSSGTSTYLWTVANTGPDVVRSGSRTITFGITNEDDTQLIQLARFPEGIVDDVVGDVRFQRLRIEYTTK